MSWSFVNGTPALRIRLANPFLDVTYPTEGAILGVFDTGYGGFVLVPDSIFRALRFHELRSQSVTLIVADGRRVRFKEVLGSLELPDIDVREDGAIQTHPKAREILVGMAALRRLAAHVDGCRRMLSLEVC